MTVSVCIPTFNSSRYLRACVDSVLRQTCQDFELVVSDCASTDDTCDIIRSYSDPRIRLFCPDRCLGMAFNLNHAAAQARGNYVKILCHDDMIEPTCLEKQVSTLDRNPALTMVTSGLRYVDANGQTLRLFIWLPEETILSTADAVAGTLVYGNVLGPPSATLLRRESLIKAGPFSDQFPQVMDLDLWLRVLALGPISYLPEPLCRFRLHPEATTERLRNTGVIRDDLRRITETMLGLVMPTRMVRRVAWGRVAGSFLKQAMAGLRSGYVRWPLAAIGQAFRIDPALAGLVLLQMLFRTGVLGITVADGTMLQVCRGQGRVGRPWAN